MLCGAPCATPPPRPLWTCRPAEEPPGLVGLAGFILVVPTLSGQGWGMREGVSRPVMVGPRFWFSSDFKHSASQRWEAAVGGDC